MSKEIIQIGDDRLRLVSEAIPESLVTDKETRKLLKDLSDALETQDDGIALSAPQIGVNKRVFVVSGKVFDEEYMDGRKDSPDENHEDQYFINPKVIKASKRKVSMEEGCLSIRGVYGNVERPKTVTVEAWNEKGEKFERGAGGILARIFQHEIDHLDGILFIDKAYETWQNDEYKEN